MFTCADRGNQNNLKKYNKEKKIYSYNLNFFDIFQFKEKIK